MRTLFLGAVPETDEDKDAMTLCRLQVAAQVGNERVGPVSLVYVAVRRKVWRRVSLDVQPYTLQEETYKDT